jgi:hypothetical protein
MILSINRKVAFSLILTAIITVIALSDAAFHLLLELMHVSFELFEQALDLIVEHTFHTDRHETQIIVFYIMLSMAGYGLYKLYKLLRTLPRRCRECGESLTAGWLLLKQAISAYWQDLPPAGKARWLMGFTASFTCMAFWVFM